MNPSQLKQNIAQKMGSFFNPSVAHAQTASPAPTQPFSLQNVPGIADMANKMQSPTFLNQDNPQPGDFAPQDKQPQVYQPGPAPTRMTKYQSDQEKYGSPNNSYAPPNSLLNQFNFDQTRTPGANTPGVPIEKTAPFGSFSTASGIPYDVQSVTQETPTVMNETKTDQNGQQSFMSPYTANTGPWAGKIPGVQQLTSPSGPAGVPRISRVKIFPGPGPGAPSQATDPVGYNNYMKSLENEIVSDFEKRNEASTTQSYEYPTSF